VVEVRTPLLCYSFRHSHSTALHGGFRYRFAAPSTLPYHAGKDARILSFGRILCPVGLSARRHSTSELLRTLSRVAASKPTSWLFMHRHILCHSAFI
jgi:hypothetical protein